jgi:hypothetical protein
MLEDLNPTSFKTVKKTDIILFKTETVFKYAEQYG